MARRPLAEEDSSVDLFLSTSCDAFGGIIFIMLLICLMPSNRDAKADVSEQKKVEPVVQPAIQPAVTESRLEEEKSALARRVAEQQEKVKTLALNAKAAQDEASAREAELAKIRRELRGAPDGDAPAQEKRRTRTPRLHDVQKNTFYVVLQKDRVYVPILPGSVWKPNKDDFRVKEQGKIVDFEAIPAKGQDANLWVSARDGLQGISQKIERDKFVIHFAVYPDSVKSFTRIRDVFIGMGFDYNWTPLKSGEALQLMQSTGGAQAQ